jgi:hypothetical protein
MRPCRPLRRALEIDHEIFEHFPETKLHYPDLDALYGFSCIKYWTLFPHVCIGVERQHLEQPLHVGC